MIDAQHLILDKDKIFQKIRRLAYHIYENNSQENEIVFAGVQESGFVLAQLVGQEFSKISPIPLRMVGISLDKFMPLQTDIVLDCELRFLENKTIILFDDVMNTGRTIAYSLKPFLNMPIKKLQTLVLVNRGHSVFPISADYVGYDLNTTINQHVTVLLKDENFGVYLH